MVSTTSDRLHLELQADGENAGTWGSIANVQFEMLEEAIAGVGTVVHDDSASYVLVMTAWTKSVDSTTNTARNMVLNVTGSLTAARNLEVPTEEKVYLVKNATTDGGGGPYAITVKTNAGSGISVPNGATMLLYCDGTNVVNGITALPAAATIGGVALVDLSSAQTLTTKTLTSPVINTGVSGTAILDSDTMAGTSATTLSSSESIKAYVDAEAVKSRIVAGTAAVFQQTAAPTNWAKSTTHNDKALRVVSGTASSGGATAFTTVFGTSKTTGSHVLTEAELAAHTHTQSVPLILNRSSTAGGTLMYSNQGSAVATGSAGSNSGHTHTLSLDPHYMDVIVATKNAY
jgi:hypothetical protein